MPSNPTLPEDVREPWIKGLLSALAGYDLHPTQKDQIMDDVLDAIAPLIIEWARKDQASTAPDGFTNAQWHTDAIADTGDGYTSHPRQYIISCLWCADVFWGSTKAEAKAKYDRHTDAMYDEQEAERQAELAVGDAQ